ncbi:MAG TPA: Holliday junction resolvase-like protein [Rectinemataceae bacterium]|nr:Holliday junction resolvase-like protein [Rectinemataceae bacterium]
MVYDASLSPPQLSYLLVVAAILVAMLFVLGLVLGLRLGRRSGRLEIERSLTERIGAAREDAVRRSRAVIGGQTAEQLAPYLPGFPFDPGDLRFIGKPIDFVAFRGASRGSVEEVVFVEVKTGGSNLSKVERSLRETIEAGRVSWMEYRPPS